MLLLPANGDPDEAMDEHEMWVAKIKEVKARPPSNEDVCILFDRTDDYLFTDRNRFGCSSNGIGHRKRWVD